jgi:hypothetical protein
LVPNLVNMADGVTPPILNPESVSWYDGLYEVRRCYAAEDDKPRHFVRFAGLSWFWSISLYLSLFIISLCFR